MKPYLYPCAVVALLLLGLMSCSEEATQGPDLREQLLEELGQNVILPLYNQFEAQTQELQQSAQAFCQAPDADSLSSLRASWQSAQGTWKQGEVFGFGPYSEEPLRLGPKIDSWPARPDTIEGTLEDPENFQNLVGVYSRGLPVIEYLIYAPGDQTLEAFALDPNRCLYLDALTGDLVQNATSLRQAWDPEGEGYLLELTESGQRDTAYSNLQMAVGEVVNRMAFTIENIQSTKLNQPLGKKSDGTPDPDLVESRFSDRSIQNIRDDIAGLEAIYYGDFGQNQGMGLRDWAQARGFNFDSAFAGHVQSANDALDAIPGPLDQAIIDDPALVEAAVDALRELRILIQSDIIGALGLTLTFNDTDGD
jgi:predicted lipoprotein